MIKLIYFVFLSIKNLFSIIEMNRNLASGPVQLGCACKIVFKKQKIIQTYGLNGSLNI